MDVQLKELIDTIKKEGVQSAEAQAAEIVKEAEQKSAEMIDRAHRESERLIAGAREEAARVEQSGRDALRQAGRDLILNLKSSITKIFEALLRDETSSVLHGKTLEEVVVALMKSWNGEELGKLEVLLSSQELAALEASLRTRLAAEMKKGLEIKSSPDSKAGFLVGEKDGKAYYDFTAAGIAEVLGEYLSPKLAELIQTEGSTT